MAASTPPARRPGRWARLRARLRPPRRLRFTSSGRWLVLGVLGIGLAALNTANNLLYLVLGGMLGLIVVSGWLSEQALRGLVVRRRIAPGVTAGRPARITYEVASRKRRLPSFSIELREKGIAGAAFLPGLAPGRTAFTRAEVVFPRRGVYPLAELTLATTFPFGFFEKQRDLELPGAVIVWPRTDRRVRAPRRAGDRARRTGPLPAGLGGGRGEYRGLRAFRPGDDPHDVHWRSSARRGDLVVREYERDEAESLWISLDLRCPRGAQAAGEAAVEVAAALADRASGRGERFGLVTQDAWIELGTGAPHLEAVLDALAAARLRPAAGPPVCAIPTDACVLVTAGGGGEPGFADRFSVEAEGVE